LAKQLWLGRSQTNDLPYPDDGLLSRNHLVFLPKADGWAVRELDTKNGTRLNGEPLRGERLLASGDVLTAGELVIEFDDSPGALLERATTLVKALGGRPAQTVSRADEMAVLLQICRELARPASEDWYGFVLGSAMEIVGADRGALMLLEGDELVQYARRGPEFSISQTIQRRVLREKLSLLVRNCVVDPTPEESQSLLLQSVQSLIAVPLQTEERVTGLIYIDNLRKECFTADHLNLVTVIAHVAAIRREQEVLAERERREREDKERTQQLAESRRRALEAAELMRHAETRAVRAETASAMTRLTAAVSHELNTPLGALRSSVETLGRAVEKSRTSGDVARLQVQAEMLSAPILAAAERMSGVVTRLQRITNLDRAEVQRIDLGALLSDVAQLAAEHCTVCVQACQLPEVVSQPQALSMAFSALFSHQGQTETRVTGGREGAFARVVVEQPEIVIGESALMELFDPSFRLVDGRMGTDNWSLFSARQLIRELGGEISVESSEAQGTVFTVLVPTNESTAG
jgi:signal transduction histidine kinase